MEKLIAQRSPKPRVLHPWSTVRFAVIDSWSIAVYEKPACRDQSHSAVNAPTASFPQHPLPVPALSPRKRLYFALRWRYDTRSSFGTLSPRQTRASARRFLEHVQSQGCLTVRSPLRQGWGQIGKFVGGIDVSKDWLDGMWCHRASITGSVTTTTAWRGLQPGCRCLPATWERRRRRAAKSMWRCRPGRLRASR